MQSKISSFFKSSSSSAPESLDPHPDLRDENDELASGKKQEDFNGYAFFLPFFPLFFQFLGYFIGIVLVGAYW